MIQTLSPNDFGALVNASITAVNEVAISPPPKKMLFDSASEDSANFNDSSQYLDDDLDDDSDDFTDNGNDDLHDDLDDNFGDWEVIDDSADQERVSFRTIEQHRLPPFLNTKVLEQDPDSKILNYSINFTVREELKDTEVNTTTLFDALVKKFDDSFLDTIDCHSYADLWNKNFITDKCANIMAFMRILAMFYNIDPINERCAQRLLDENSESLIEKIQQLGRQVTVDDIAIALGEKEAAPVIHETEESIDSELAVEGVRAVTSTPTIDSFAPPNPSPLSTTTKKLTRKQKLSEIAARARDILLTEKTKLRIERIRLLTSSFDALTDCFKKEHIMSEEYIKFLTFLARTREIVLNTDILAGNQTFNQYVARLLCKTFNVAYADGDYSETVAVVGVNGIVTEFFSDFILLNWRLFQAATTKRTTLKVLPMQEKLLPVLLLDGSANMPKIMHKDLTSPLTLFANDFIDKVMEDINASAPTNFPYNTDDVDDYVLIRMGMQVPNCVRIMTRHQKALFNIVIAYLAKHQPEFFRLAVTGKAPSIFSIRISKLSDNDTMASYQILAQIFSKEVGAQVRLEHVPKESQPTIILTGDGVPGSAIEWTLADFVDNYDIIFEHSCVSTNVTLSISLHKLIINFQK